MAECITFDYYRGMQADMYSFYRIPKMLFTSTVFKGLSCEAKVLYGLMLDRMSLSIKNRWFDEEDRVYIIFTVDDVMEYLNCRTEKATKILSELDGKKGIGLIERKRIGMGKANIIYVKNFMINDVDKNSLDAEAKKVAERPIESQNFENRKSRNSEIENQEFRKSKIKNFENQTSRISKIENQEFRKSKGNYTNNNYTDFNDTNPSIYPEKEMDRRNAYTEIVMDNIEYQTLCHDYAAKEIDEIVDLITDTICSKKQHISINGEPVPIELVKSKFMKLDYLHMQYVFKCLKENTSKIRNIRQYILTVLYNAPVTMNHYYQAEVNYDMSGEPV